jgi:hypothetical protein
MKFSSFLSEQILAILFFALTAAVCVQIFTVSSNMSDESQQLNYALILAQSGAEAFKAAEGDIQTTAQILRSNTAGSQSIDLYYNDSWQECAATDAAYQMTINQLSPAAEGLQSGIICITAAAGKNQGTVIFQLPVIARATMP